MKILVLGGDGYLGWPQSLFFSSQGHEVAIVDNLSRRLIDDEFNLNSLFPILSIYDRAMLWYGETEKCASFYHCDISKEYENLCDILEIFQPDTIVHFAEQRSAPYSMIDHYHTLYTMRNNVLGTLNLLYAIKEIVPNCHLIKLGTMGEYGTPNIDIEEGFIEIEHKGRKDILPYPKQPGSFYHLSKVHDSNNMMFCCKIWGLRVTDINQGIVYGSETNETKLDIGLSTRFDYDHIYGTVLNRFLCQAVMDYPLTVYGSGNQVRGYINIQDTVRCIGLAADNPPAQGQYEVFNQITEQFSVWQLAKKIQRLKKDVTIENIINPRVESEAHYYNVTNTKLIDLGLKPNFLSDEFIIKSLDKVSQYKDRINKELFHPTVKWDGKT